MAFAMVIFRGMMSPGGGGQNVRSHDVDMLLMLRRLTTAITPAMTSSVAVGLPAAKSRLQRRQACNYRTALKP